MGFVGPIPNRSGDMSRERDAHTGGRAEIRKGELKPREFYAPDPNWHPTCQRIWNSLPDSGMFEFTQNTDFALLWSLLEDLSNAKIRADKNDKPISAMLITAVYNQLNNFGFSEGDRRKMRIELEEPAEEETVEQAAIETYQDALNVISLPKRGKSA